MRYFIGLSVPDELAAAIVDIRRQFGVAGEAINKNSEPHMTLIPPFETSIAPEAIADELARSLTLIEPFTLETTKLGSFPPRVWYLGVEPHESLIALHELVARVIETRPSEYHFRGGSEKFHPHLTLMTRLTPDEFRAAEAILRATNLPPTSWRVDTIQLYRRETDRWERDRAISFA